MGLGKFNRFTIQITSADTAGAGFDFAGDTNLNNMAGSTPVLPVDAVLEVAYASLQTVVAAHDVKLSVYAGATEIVDQVTLNNTTQSGVMTQIAAQEGKKWPAGTVLSVKEQSAAGSNVAGACVVLVFREREP